MGHSPEMMYTVIDVDTGNPIGGTRLRSLRKAFNRGDAWFKVNPRDKDFVVLDPYGSAVPRSAIPEEDES